jgi:uncharacterized protein
MYEKQRSQNVLCSILIKPAGPDCNLSCTYCFYRGKAQLFLESDIHRMDDRVLEGTIRQMMGLSPPQLSLGWQGGEPTLMGLGFFERAIELQKRFGSKKRVSNSLQTNGLLIDAKWAHFLAKYNFLVGLSIDGPAHVNDRYRTTRDGAGTWRRIADTSKRLLDAGVLVNALTVVTEHSAKFAEEIYASLKAMGITFHQYIPCVEPPPFESSITKPFAVSPESYGAFLSKIFDLWYADIKDGVPTIVVRYFDALLRQYMGDTPSDCTLLDTCGVYLVVEHNGDVFPCDFFVKETHRLGNLLSTPLSSLFASADMKAFGHNKQALPAPCLQCQWLALCRGGCPKDRPRSEHGSQTSYFCESFRCFLEYADDRLRTLAARIKRDALKERQAAVVEAVRRKDLHIGRNSPCPCGSGKKYKKCCLINHASD